MHRLLRHLDSGFLALVPCSRASSSPATATASPSTLATPGDHPNPAEFAVAAEQAASTRAASIVSAHSQPDNQYRHRPGRRPARGRSRHLGRRVRRAKASGRVVHRLKRRL